MEREYRVLIVEEHTVHRALRSGVLPLELGRQAGAGPRRVRVGFVVGDVYDRLVWVELAHPTERVDPPAAGVVRMAIPVQRSLPALGLHPRPAVRLPQLGTSIAAVVDEREPLAGGDEAVGERVVVEADLVARTLVVERESGDRTGIVAAVADLGEPTAEVDPSRGPRIGCTGHHHIDVGRPDGRIHRQHVLDVEQQELLVLLLVMRAQHDRVREFGPGTCAEQLIDRGVDVCPVVGHLGDRGARDEPALGTGVTSADRLVVAVVEEAILRSVPHPVAGAVGAEHELGEEPRGVRPMPLGRAGVGHRLDHLVLGAQRRRQTIGARPDRRESALQVSGSVRHVDGHTGFQRAIARVCSRTRRSRHPQHVDWR